MQSQKYLISLIVILLTASGIWLPLHLPIAHATENELKSPATTSLSVTAAEFPSTTVVSVPFNAVFLAYATGGASPYMISWTVSSGSTANTANACPTLNSNPLSCTFATPADYSVSAQVTDLNGLTSFSNTISINAKNGQYSAGLTFQEGDGSTIGFLSRKTVPFITISEGGQPNGGTIVSGQNGLIFQTDLNINWGGVILPDFVASFLGYSYPWYSLSISGEAGTPWAGVPPADAWPAIQLGSSICAVPPCSQTIYADVSNFQITPGVSGLINQQFNFTVSPKTTIAFAEDLVGIVFTAAGVALGGKTFQAAIAHAAATYLVQNGVSYIAQILDCFSTPLNCANVITQSLQNLLPALETYFANLAFALAGAGITQVLTDVKRGATEAAGMAAAVAPFVYDFIALGAVLIKGIQWDMYQVTTLASPPQPTITSVTYPSTISLRQSATIRVQAANSGGPASWQTIAVSFPSNPSSNSISINSYDLDSAFTYLPSQSVTGCYSACSVSLNYPLVQGISNNWATGTTHSMTIVVTPSSAGPFTFLVKSVAGSSQALAWDPLSMNAPNCSQCVLDQQMELVYSYTVQINSPDFSISTSPPTVIVPQGKSIQDSITLTSINGYNNLVTLSTSNLPTGVSVTFNPSAGSPSFTATLRLAATSSANPGVYPITISGLGSDGTRHSAALSLAIGLSFHSTSVGVSPNPWSIAAGQTVVYSLTVTDLGGTPTVPTGAVSWNDGGMGGTFVNGPTCTLGRGSSNTGLCAIDYQTSVSGGSVTINAAYQGDSSHLSSSGTASLSVLGSGGSGYCNQPVTGSVTLGTDIVCPSGNGPILQGNNVVFDCAGHSITNQNGGGRGIMINSASGDTIKNCRISNFQIGIWDSSNVCSSCKDTITGNTVSSSVAGYGIYLDGTQSTTLSNNLVVGSALYGFYLATSSSIITNNNATSNGTGGFLFVAIFASNTFSGNTAIGNGGDGFHLPGNTSQNTLNSNTAYGNTGNGFILDGSTQNSFTGNVANGNGVNGFRVICNQFSCGSANSFASSSANNNAQYGFLDNTSGSGTAKTADTYTTDSCNGNTLGGSNPVGLCSGPPTILTLTTTSAGQILNLTTVSSFSGGTPPYKCEWFKEAPGTSTYTPLGSFFTCDPSSLPSVLTGPLSPAGIWSFKLQVNDSSAAPATLGSDPVIFSSNSGNVTVTYALTSTIVSCTLSGLNLTTSTTCTATVTGVSPSGTVSWSEIGAGTISFSSGSCMLSSGYCQVTATGIAAGLVFIQALYSGDSTNTGSSSNSTSIVVNPMFTSTAVACTGPVNVGFASVCNVTIGGNYVSTNGDAVSFAASGAGAFSPPTCTVSSGGCSTNYSPTSGMGSAQTITATYNGDSNNRASFSTNLLRINLPFINLSPDSVKVGTNVTINGANLLPSSNLIVTYDGSPAGAPICRTNASGVVASGCVFKVPYSAAGPHTIQASDGTNAIASPLTVSGFTISKATSWLTAPIANNATTPLQFPSQYGYSGNVSLTAAITIESTALPSGLGGSHDLELAPPSTLPSVSLSPMSLVLAGGGNPQSNLTVTLTPGVLAGDYAIIVTAIDGVISHTVELTVIATDFNLVSRQDTVTVPSGSNATLTLGLQSLNGFQGNLTLSSSISPSTIAVTLNPASLYITSGGNSSLLTIMVPSNTPPGKYTVSLQGTTGGLSHTIYITVSVPGPQTLNLAALFGSNGTRSILVLGIVGLFALLSVCVLGVRSRQHPRTVRSTTYKHQPFDKKVSSVHPLYTIVTRTPLAKDYD
jgi:parallel beta-helix repeat protein